MLQKMIDTSGVSRARIAIAAGIGHNRSGRIFRFESPSGQIRGWTQETIDEWMTSRPGRGNRTHSRGKSPRE